MAENTELKRTNNEEYVFERDFISPDRPSTCTWKSGQNNHTANPHVIRQLKGRPKRMHSILEAVGNTPLVKLNNIPRSEGIVCEMYAKCEFLNPGGSVKDRIALRMIEEAEANGTIKPGFTLIEPTSGNTDRNVVDEWIKTKDNDALPMARRLIKEEGLLCSGSSGGIMWAALQAAKSLKPGQRCVVVLADNVRNYMTKFVSEEWVKERNFPMV